MARRTLYLLILTGVLCGDGLTSSLPVFAAEPSSHGRKAAIARSQVWAPTDIATMDIKAGPQGPGGFALHAEVHCDYVEREMSGRSPKFMCLVAPDDEVKIKFGGTNGEVFGEIAASRLLWALGFGADRMYPVRVVCRGCPTKFNGIARPGGEQVFAPAVAERKMSGREFKGNSGWSWEELDLIDEEAGGAPRAHRDALKLLAVFLQHTDNKADQQRLLCLGDDEAPLEEVSCERPFMMLNDVGLTFGRATTFNSNATSGVNLTAWAGTSVWKGPKGCIGDLKASFTGTLSYPSISEEGRQFLAGLLLQLSDAQLRDLFEVSRFDVRLRTPDRARSGFPSLEEWVDAFKAKRSQIVDRRCS
jgi:hypothetical protein